MWTATRPLPLATASAVSRLCCSSRAARWRSRLSATCPRRRSTRASPRSWLLPQSRNRSSRYRKGPANPPGLFFLSRNQARSGVFPQNSQHPALNRKLFCGYEDGGHLHIRGLEANLVAFYVIALQRGFASADQGHNDFPRASGFHTLDQHIIPVHDVLVSHRIAPHFQRE